MGILGISDRGTIAVVPAGHDAVHLSKSRPCLDGRRATADARKICVGSDTDAAIGIERVLVEAAHALAKLGVAP
jgi:hypothetical protein